MSDPVLRTRKELDDVFGNANDYPGRPDGADVVDLRPRREMQLRDEMPGSDELVDEQVTDAVYRLHEDTTSYPQFPWPSLANLSGPICPEDLVMIAARTGGGKSLFLQNLFDAFVCEGRIGVYIGLEQSPMVLRIKWACLRTDVAPKFMLATKKGDRGSEDWQLAMAKVQEDLRWQRSPEIRVRAHFATDRTITAGGLRRWTEWAVDLGADFVLVDHIDRIQHGDGKNSFHEMSQTVRMAKELAIQHRIAMIVASQVGRPADALEQFMPPSLHALRGGGTKEEESDTVIGIYRPLRMSVTEQELKQVRQGLRDRDTVIEPNTMGVMLLKHRLDGPCAGKIVKLDVRHQRVYELAERDRWTTEGHYPKEIV